MSKAILVIDMPSKCEECCFCRGFNVCRIKQCIEREGITSIHTVDKQIMEGTKPSWCPLKPMPEKVIGYKDCINEIVEVVEK